jgi:hypothetical protein
MVAFATATAHREGAIILGRAAQNSQSPPRIDRLKSNKIHAGEEANA